MRKLQLKTMLLMLLMAVGGLSPAWAADKTVVKYSFDDALSPSLTAGSRVSFDYDKTSVITSTKFLNAYNNANGDPGSSTVSLGSTDLSGETWTLSFEWAACGGCNSKADHTTLKAGDTNLFDLTGNSNWNTTVTITYAGSDGTKTLPVPGCDKNKRFKADVGDQLNTETYWHHIVVTGSASGVKMTITNSSTGTAVVEDVLLSETNVNPTSLIIEPCCGGAIGIDELSLTYFVEGEVIQTPTANYTAVNGTERTITATCDTEGATLYYSTDGENWTEGASVTVSASGNVYFKAVKGNSESDVLTFEAVAGEAITLNAPTIVRSDNTTVTISADQTNLLLSPTATIKYTYGNEAGEFTGSKTLTVAADATITAYAEATGYTTSATSERAVALFPEYVNTVENTPTVTKGTTTFALSTETIIVSEREYAALLLDNEQWGTNVYLQNLTITDPIVWGIRNGNWYINTTDPQWILIRNLKAGDIVVVDVTYPAADMVNATYSEKLSFGSRHAYIVEADGDVELNLRKTNAKEMQYFYGVYAYRSATVAVTGITLNKTSASLTTGDVLNLTATIEPDDATDKTVTWTSSDETVATVSEGVVTTLKAGTATITATANGGTDVTATCDITVANDPYAGEHYIYSAADDKFLSRGADWGTRAIADNYGVPANVILNDGVYNIQFLDNELYLGSDGYADKASDYDNVAWTIEETEGGFKLKNNDSYAKITDGFVNIDGTAETATVWSFKTPEEQAAILATKQLADHIAIAAAADKEVATEEAFATMISENYVGQNVTATYLGSDNLNGGNAGSWTVNGVRKLDDSWAAFVGGGNGVTESFSAATTLTKELTGLTEGIYKVTMNGFFRQGNNGVCWNMKEAGFLPSTVYLQAGNYATPLKAWGVSATKNGDSYTPDNTEQAATAFNNGDYVNEVYTYVGEDGNLTLSINIPNFIYWAGWACYNNVQLTYYVPKSSSIDVTGIALNETSASLTTGDALTLSAIITPDNATDQSVTWTSSDETVATVSAAGVVSALKAGTATITATANGGTDVTATCTVTVADAPALAYNTVIKGTGKYLLRNVATGKYMNAANTWGTQASLADHGVLLTATLEEGTYKLTNIVASGNGLGSNGYADNGTPVALNVTLAEGETNIYNLSPAAGKYVSAQVGTTVISMEGNSAASTLAQWQFISEDDMKKNMTIATAENPIDMTYFIMDPNFSRNNGYYNSWKWTFTNGENKNNAGDNSNFNVECYGKPFDFKQTITVPNGIYRVRAQAFYRQDGSDNENMPYIFANDEKVYFPVKTGTENSMSDASASFSNGLYYTDYATVTVTDHTLSVGAHNDNTGALWCIWDNFSLEMIGYTPVTAINATIDNAEFEIGQTATISDVTVTPADASFTGYSFSTSDEAVATVDANGVVTGVAAGEATITVKAEMENVTKTFDVTIVTPAVVPTDITLNETKIELDATTTTLKLTAVVGPEGANQAVTFASSDETVATVNDEGVVTAVQSGTATITVTSAAKPELTAKATVTVTFPETEVPALTYTNDGATRTVSQLGANLIKNGAFEYPNNFYGWTTGSGAAMSADNFNLITEDDNHYIKAKAHTGAGGANSIGTGWAIEAGKTYVFGYKVKSTSAGNSEFHVVSLTNTLGTETMKVSKTETAVGTDWTDVAYTFTNPATDGYAYVQFRARWLNSAVSFDDFYLCEAVSTTEGNVDYVTAAIPTANIGTGAFQYSQDAIDAANNLVQGTATVEDVQNAYDALTTINEPSNGQLFNVILTYSGWTYDQKAMTYLANGRNDAGLYNIQYKETANKNLAQAFTFTKVSGNNYTMSQIDADGNVRYISTGVPYGGNTSQIRTTTDASKALVVTVIPTATEGKWNLRNTEANQFIGSQDAGVYTVNSHIDFNIVETTKPSIEINTTSAGWGTVMLPFAQELPAEVKAYTCAEVSEDKLTIIEVNALEANKPYLIEGAWDKTVTGDAQGTALTYTEGLFTGVYADAAAPVGSYVLQNKNEKLAFYKVAEGEGKQPTVGSNHAYLTVPASVRDAFFFGDGETTAISTLKALSEGTVEIYSLNGVKQSKLQKGTNILKMSDGSIRKVMVK